jgi:DNA-binding MarR family transcriptional regulator
MADPPSDRIDVILDQWRRERPDLDPGPLGVVGRLLLVAQLSEARLREGLAGFDLQPSWFDILAPLRRAGPPFELTPGQLMDATMLSSGGMTKRIDRLVDAGLVRRRPDPDDRRGTRVRLTARGKALIDRAIATHIVNEKRLLSLLSAADRRSLDRILRRLVAGLDAR